MKPWMKFLMWFGLGGFVGFFAGQQVGYKKGNADACASFNVEPATIYKVEEIGQGEPVDIQSVEEYQKSMREKYGWPDPEWQVVGQPGTDEDAEMPMDEPIVPEPENEGTGDIIHGRKMSDIESASALFDDPPTIPVNDIPQFHPTFLDIRVVDKSEYDNRGDLDEENLIFYEGDEVLYNCRTQQIIPDDEYNATIGVGTLEAFRVGPGPAKDEIYVINENNCRYTIQRMDDAFTDAVDGNCAPTDDDNDNDDADEEDDFWNDGDG